MRGYQASYGGYLLPEEINDRKLPTKDIAVMTEARDWLMSAFDSRARVHAAALAAQAQVYFDCWMYKVEDPSQAADIERCRKGFLTSMDKIEDILANLEETPAMAEPKPSTEVAIKSASTSVSDKAALAPAPNVHAIYFDTDISIPQDESAAALPEMARQLIEDIRSKQNAEVVIEGHADRQGGENYNVGLSQRRAEVIRDMLQQLGLEAAALKLDWFGETKPTVDTSDGQPEQQNRRVDVYVR